MIVSLMMGNISAGSTDKTADTASGTAFSQFVIQKLTAERNSYQEAPPGTFTQKSGTTSIGIYPDQVQAIDNLLYEMRRDPSRVTALVEEKLLDKREILRHLFIDILKEAGPGQFKISPETLQILTAMVEDKPLTERQWNYLKKRSNIQEPPYEGQQKNVFSIQAKKEPSGYDESFRRTAVRALGVIGRHQTLPSETLLVLTKKTADKLENFYVLRYLPEALSMQSRFLFSDEVVKDFENLFDTDITFWIHSSDIIPHANRVLLMQSHWRRMGETAKALEQIANRQGIPDSVLRSMAEVLSFSPDQTILETMGERELEKDLAMIDEDRSSDDKNSAMRYLHTKRERMLENGAKIISNLREQVAGALKKISRQQALPRDVAQKLQEAQLAGNESCQSKFHE